MNSKVIYTSLVGAYDTLLQPRYIHPDFDYICFSNNVLQAEAGIWNIRRIPYSHPDKTRHSRYVKLNPHKVLQTYTCSLWIDANIEIMDETIYNRAIHLINAGSLIAQVQHAERDCIYEDIACCIRASKDKEAMLCQQYRFLKQAGYPAHYGLSENNIIYRQHNEKPVVEISENWWQLYLQFSKRDQLSLYYVYWKHNFRPDLLLSEGINARNCSGLQYHPHTPQKPPVLKRMLKNIKWIVNLHRARKERIIASLTSKTTLPVK
jgi:hypothetical protein